MTKRNQLRGLGSKRSPTDEDQRSAEPKIAAASGLSHGAYLVDVQKEDIHLDEQNPIFVRHKIVRRGDPLESHFHPYLEFGIRFQGTGMFLVEGEATMRYPYDVYLGAINQPHQGGIIS